MVLFNKSAMKEFHKGLTTALATVTTLTSVKVYDHIPSDQTTYPYIVVRDMSESPWGDKTCYGATITLSINTYIQDKNSLSTKDLCDKIISALQDNFSVTGFTMIYSELTSIDVSEMADSVFLGDISLNFFLREVISDGTTD